MGAGTIDLPVVEASGLATTMVGNRVRVSVVGDHSARIGTATIDPHGLPNSWEVVDLTTLDGWPDFGDSSQFEAIAVDSGSTVALLREDPAVVLIGDTRTRSFRAHITLTAPAGSPLHELWGDPSSRGEGLLFLRGGRLLVAKEKHPSALVEFCPVGASPRGLSADDFLGPDEEWVSPEGEAEFVAMSVWQLRGRAKKALRDVSALGLGPERSLWLLSDKSCSFGRVSLDSPLPPGSGEIAELADVWRLPKGTTKPEGVAIIDDNRILVAMDTKSRHDNGILIERPD